MMKLQNFLYSLRMLSLTLLALPVACSQSRANLPALSADASAELHAAPSTNFGESLRVLNVQQYEDRMPIVTEDGRPVPPRFITIIQFEALDCDTTRDDEFNLRLSRKGRAAVVRIESQKNRGGCTKGRRQTYEVSSREFKRGEAVVISNPTLIEELPATE